MNSSLHDQLWQWSVFRIKEQAAALLAEGQSFEMARAFIAQSLTELELKLGVEASAHSVADKAFAEVIRTRRPPPPPER